MIRYELDAGVVSIVLDRPPLNTYDAELHAQLAQAWVRAAHDPDARAIVLRAEGKHFCAGADLNTLPTTARAQKILEPPAEMTFIRNLMKPTIAAVQGGCIGGGQRFVFPCDLIFCSSDAFFCDPMVGLGIGGIQPPIHTWLYGPRLAKEMLFSGMRLPADRLYVTGAVNRIYDRDDLVAETLAFARHLATLDPLALRQAKRSVNTTMDIAGQHYIESRFAELLDDAPTLHLNGFRPEDRLNAPD